MEISFLFMYFPEKFLQANSVDPDQTPPLRRLNGVCTVCKKLQNSVDRLQNTPKRVSSLKKVIIFSFLRCNKTSRDGILYHEHIVKRFDFHYCPTFIKMSVVVCQQLIISRL